MQNYEIKNYKIPLLCHYFSQPKVSFYLSKKFSSDPIMNSNNNFYNTWIGLKFYDYYSGLSFWTRSKGNDEHNIMRIGVGYTFFDMHEISFETTNTDHQKMEIASLTKIFLVTILF